LVLEPCIAAPLPLPVLVLLRLLLPLGASLSNGRGGEAL